MDNKSAEFIRKHRVMGPLIVALILAIVLVQFTSLDPKIGLAIAALVGLSDYIALGWMLKIMERGDG